MPTKAMETKIHRIVPTTKLSPPLDRPKTSVANVKVDSPNSSCSTATSIAHTPASSISSLAT